MTTKQVITEFVISPEFDQFFGFNDYRPEVSEYPNIHWYFKTFLDDTRITFIEAPQQNYYLVDPATFTIRGALPLTNRELVYFVFVSSLLYYRDPELSVSEQWVRLHCWYRFPTEVADFLEVLRKFVS